jgi:hypothetical protein
MAVFWKTAVCTGIARQPTITAAPRLESMEKLGVKGSLR